MATTTRLKVEYDYGQGWCQFAGFSCDVPAFLRKAKISLKQGVKMFPQYKFRLVSVAPDGTLTEIKYKK
jgi:hypothetical protein